MIVVLVAIILFFIFFSRSRSHYLSEVRGKEGERYVAWKLNYLPEGDYKVLNDVILPTSTGSVQIDHIVVSIFGVFVIETKNYSGWIYGGEYSEYWTQNIYGHKYRFYNPVLQNAGHVRAVRKVLTTFNQMPILSIVAFSSEADVEVKKHDSCIVYWEQLLEVIRHFNKRYLTPLQVDEIYSALMSAQLNHDEAIRGLHIQNIDKAKSQKEAAISSGHCPRCGGTLVLRNGKYGKFYGCSNYPLCRYTLHVS